MSANLIHRYTSRTGCAGDQNASHDWKVVRLRGTRTRSQCIGCGAMTGWEKGIPVPNLDVEAGLSQVLEAPVEPQPSNVDLVYAAAQEERDLVLSTYYNNMTLREAQQKAKEQGMKGYSKLRKDDLIAALQKIAGVD